MNYLYIYNIILLIYNLKLNGTQNIFKKYKKFMNSKFPNPPITNPDQISDFES